MTKANTQERTLFISIAAIAVLIRVCLLCCSQDFLITNRLPDDALYYFATAKNWAHGNGISFDGLHLTNGFHPLWLLVITPVFLFGASGWSAVTIILLQQSLLDCIILFILYRGIQQFAPERNRTTALLLSAGIYAINPIAACRSINGLETTITALLLLLWSLQYIRQWSLTQWSVRDTIVFGITSGLLFLARTDMAVVIAVACIARILHQVRSIKDLAVAGVIAVAIISPWLLWNQSHFGSIVQVSADAVPFMGWKKLHELYSGSGLAMYLAKESLRNLLKPFYYTSAGISLLVLILALREREARQRLAPVFIIIISALLLLLYHTLVRGFIRDWYVEQWIATFLLSTGLATGYLSPKLPLRILTGIAIAAMTILWWSELRAPKYGSQYTVVHAGIPAVGSLPRGSTVGALNSGYYGYFAPDSIRVLNLDGVVSEEAYHAIKAGDIHSYLSREHVDYLLEFPGDLSGYRSLIDPNFTQDFAVVRKVGVPAPKYTADSLLLFQRTRY